VSHPDPHRPPDLRPIQVGEVWENRVTGERATILELPYKNPEGRVTAELTALVRARASLGNIATPPSSSASLCSRGELALKRDGQTTVVGERASAVIEAGVWHDWWNASHRNALARVEVTPGERFAHVIEILFGLARLGHVNAKGMPSLLQLALVGREFSDVIVFRKPPPAVQGALFGALAPIAHWRGYRATYPQLSRAVLAPRT
jgi:quercetin dioxygenase-like cupin family protein